MFLDFVLREWTEAGFVSNDATDVPEIMTTSINVS